MTLACAHPVGVPVTCSYHCITRYARRALRLGEEPLNRKERIDGAERSFKEISMRPCSGEIDGFFVPVVDQQPIGFDMTVSKILPFAAQCVVFVPALQTLTETKDFHDRPKSCEVLSAFSQSFHIALKLLGGNQNARRWSAVRGHVIMLPASWPAPWRPCSDSTRVSG
jgi:hypothetical protein